MGSAAIRTEHDRQMTIKRLQSAELPCTVSITKGAPRSIEQNKLQRKWMNELEEQGDMTAEEYRGYCKAWHGIPILLAENEEFAEVYERLIRPHAYEEKLEMMRTPIDLPITRIMTTKQKKQYLDRVYEYWTGRGFVLTDPE